MYIMKRIGPIITADTQLTVGGWQEVGRWKLILKIGRRWDVGLKKQVGSMGRCL